MRTGELARWLNVSVSSIKVWSREFAAFLSPAAQGGDNSQRRYFDDRDARILALVADLRSRNISWEDIHATLARMQAEDWADLPPMPSAPPGVVPGPLVPQSEAQQALLQQRQALTREIALLNDRVDALQADLAEERSAHATTRQELSATLTALGELRGKLEVLEPERAHYLAQRDELAATRQALGELRGRLDAIERERETIARQQEQERQLHTRLLLVLGAVAILVSAALILLAISGGTG